MTLLAVPGLEQAGTALLAWASIIQQAMLDALHFVVGNGWLPVWALLRPREDA